LTQNGSKDEEQRNDQDIPFLNWTDIALQNLNIFAQNSQFKRRS